MGSTGMAHPRNSQSLTNVGYASSLTWANPLLTSLEQQILIPIFGEDPVELGVGRNADEVLARITDDPVYQPLLDRAFPDETVSWDVVAKALASFVRSLVSGNSRFDQYVYRGVSESLTDAELRGMELFFSERLECHHCHGGFNFSNSILHEDSKFEASPFHNTGLYNLGGDGSYPGPNTGLHGVTAKPEDMGRFRTPTLRNIELTAPYMHDGSIETLEEVIAHYAAGGRTIEEGPNAGVGTENPYKSGFVSGFSLSPDEQRDLVAFLKSLTDRSFVENPQFQNPFSEE